MRVQPRRPILLLEGQVVGAGLGKDVHVRLGRAGLLERTGGELRLRFVGFVHTQAAPLLVVLPKLVDEAAPVDPIDLLAVLRRYQTRRDRPGLAELEGDLIDDGGGIELFMQLLDWTSRHGWASDQEEVSQVGGAGRIDWRRTLRHAMPGHSRTATVYLPEHRMRQRSRLARVASVQARALLELWRDGAPLTTHLLPRGSELLLEAEEHTVKVATMSLTACAELLLEREEEIHRDHELELCRLLRMWLDGTSGPAGERLYGLRSFAGVWEDCCRVVLGQSAELSHASLAAQPAVRHLDSAGRLARWQGLSPQRPDLLLRHPEDDAVLVLDAKYYRWPHGVPGTPDVVKQVAYELTLEPGLELGGNAWLVPGNGHPQHVAQVCFRRPGGESLAPLPRVDVISLPWSRVLTTYLGRKSPQELRAAILELVSRRPPEGPGS